MNSAAAVLGEICCERRIDFRHVIPQNSTFHVHFQRRRFLCFVITDQSPQNADLISSLCRYGQISLFQQNPSLLDSTIESQVHIRTQSQIQEKSSSTMPWFFSKFFFSLHFPLLSLPLCVFNAFSMLMLNESTKPSICQRQQQPPNQK